MISRSALAPGFLVTSGQTKREPVPADLQNDLFSCDETLSLATHGEARVVKARFLLDNEGPSRCQILGDYLKRRKLLTADGSHDGLEERVVL